MWDSIHLSCIKENETANSSSRSIFFSDACIAYISVFFRFLGSNIVLFSAALHLNRWNFFAKCLFVHTFLFTFLYLVCKFLSILLSFISKAFNEIHYNFYKLFPLFTFVVPNVYFSLLTSSGTCAGDQYSRNPTLVTLATPTITKR